MRSARLDLRKKGNLRNSIYDQGQAYTEREHREWLAEAGFTDFERKILFPRAACGGLRYFTVAFSHHPSSERIFA